MKSNKLLSNILLTFILIVSVFLVSAPMGYAQTDQDWSEPVNLSFSGASSDPLLVIDSSGVMHVIWVDEFDGYKYVESTDGVTWSLPQIVNYPFSPLNDFRPVLVPNIDNSINFLWRDQENSLYYKRAQSESLDNPTAWGETIKLADSVLDFDALVDSQGGLHVSYVTNAVTDGNPVGIYYRKLGSAGWSTTRNLYTSQYFRSIGLEDSRVRISVTNNSAGSEVVFVVWDDRPQRRIFLAKSLDGGVNWGEPYQIRGPEDFMGFDIPFNVDIDATTDDVLLLWQLGVPGGRCIQYSQWSVDGGNQFTEPTKMLGDFASCPKRSDFVFRNEEFSVVLLNILDDLTLIAWNGSRWSAMQSQIDLTVFSNSVTLENVIFGCQNTSVFNDVLYVVGCDKGAGGDIWFRSRPIGSIENWFPPPSVWTSPIEVTRVRQNIASLISVTDDRNYVHTFWVQTPLSETDDGDVTIQYTRWDGEEWSKPNAIISGFDTIPTQLSVVIDSHGRLLLLWVGGENGDINLSWANADRANLSSEWSQPQRVPTDSEINRSPSILVDSSGKIVVAYAIPLNERRGIYLITSDDLGENWSQPVQVFDAVAAKWDSIDRPTISLSEDGRLHLLFSRHSLRDDAQSAGLYYSQSSNGGMAWSQPEIVSENPVQWSRFISFGNHVLHRIWEEKNGVSVDVIHQVSRDGGISWDSSNKISSIGGDSTFAALSADWDDHIYIAHGHAMDRDMVVKVFDWDGSRWISLDEMKINLNWGGGQYLINVGVVSQGFLNVVVSVNYPDLTNDLENEVFSLYRSVGQPDNSQPSFPLLISTPDESSIMMASPEIQPTSTEDSPLAGLYDSPVPSYKNKVGLLLVVGIIGVIVLFLLVARSGNKKTE